MPHKPNMTQMTLCVLQALGRPASVRFMRHLITLRYGKNVSAGMLSRMLHARTVDAIRAGNCADSVLVCPAMSFDRGEPIYGYLCRSDWLLADRIMAPLSLRVIALSEALHLVDMVMSCEHVTDQDLLAGLARSYASDMGVRAPSNSDCMIAWKSSCTNLLAEIEEDDRRDRQRAAAALNSELDAIACIIGRTP